MQQSLCCNAFSGPILEQLYHIYHGVSRLYRTFYISSSNALHLTYCDDCADGTIQVIQGSESISIISNDSNSKQLGNLYNQVKLLQAGKA